MAILLFFLPLLLQSMLVLAVLTQTVADAGASNTDITLYMTEKKKVIACCSYKHVLASIANSSASRTKQSKLMVIKGSKAGANVVN